MKLRRDHGWRMRRPRLVAVTAAIGLGAAAAVLSYDHALTVARWWGTAGWTAFLVPLLPDGLIVVCSAALYEAAKAKAARPWQATAGLALGIAVTVVLNVASGWPHGWATRCLNALAPVVLLVALEVLLAMFRRSRARAPEHAAAVVPECPHAGVAQSPDEAIRADFEHHRDCLLEPVSQRDHAAAWGVSKTTVARLVAPVPALNGHALNGDGHGPS